MKREMLFKGTKGDWKYYKNNYGSDSFTISTSTGLGLFVSGFNSNTFEREANALLISKAPEMLEMLEKAKSELSRIKGSMMAHPDCTEGSEFDDYTNSAEEVEKEIEQLIKQATEI